MADLLVLRRAANSVHNGAGFSGKTRTYWACRKGKSGLSATERAVGKYARAAFAKKKRNRAVSPEYQIVRGESQGEREPHLEEREGDQSESKRKKGVDSTVKEGRFQGGGGKQGELP